MKNDTIWRELIRQPIKGEHTMPVKTIGKKIIEKKTGKVVATASSISNAKKSARVRNMAYAGKKLKKALDK